MLHKKGPSSSQEHSVKMPLIKLIQIAAKVITLNHLSVWLNHQPPHQVEKLNTILTTIATLSTADQNMIAHQLTTQIMDTVRQLEEPGKRISTMLKRDSNSKCNMKAKRKLNCAETLKCTVNANSETPAHTPTEPISSKRKPIFQATLWQSFALNSTKMVYACTEKDANSCTVFMI